MTKRNKDRQLYDGELSASDTPLTEAPHLRLDLVRKHFEIILRLEYFATARSNLTALEFSNPWGGIWMTRNSAVKFLPTSPRHSTSTMEHTICTKHGTSSSSLDPLCRHVLQRSFRWLICRVSNFQVINFLFQWDSRV